MNRRAFFGVIGAALVAAKCPAVPLHRAASFGNRFPQMGVYLGGRRYGKTALNRELIAIQARMNDLNSQILEQVSYHVYTPNGSIRTTDPLKADAFLKAGGKTSALQ